MQPAKHHLKTTQQANIVDQFGELTSESIYTLVKEAAADDFGGSLTPRLYKLIDACTRAPQQFESLRLTTITACIDFISEYLKKCSRTELFSFLDLITRSAFIDFAPLREALANYVEPRSGAFNQNVADVAVALLQHRGAPASACAEAWLPLLKTQFSKSPTWYLLDVMAEILGLIPEEMYSKSALLLDMERLRSAPDFKDQIERRRHKWEKFGWLAIELTERKPIISEEARTSFTTLAKRAERAQSGNGVA